MVTKKIITSKVVNGKTIFTLKTVKMSEKEAKQINENAIEQEKKGLVNLYTEAFYIQKANEINRDSLLDEINIGRTFLDL